MGVLAVTLDYSDLEDESHKPDGESGRTEVPELPHQPWANGLELFWFKALLLWLLLYATKPISGPFHTKRGNSKQLAVKGNSPTTFT